MFLRLMQSAWLLALPLAVPADDDRADVPALLDPVVVTPSPVGTTLAESLQSVSVITRADIKAAPAATLADLLAMVAGVDIRRRGAAGVQADVGIRGTAYEQTLVLVNGIPLKDPQTGHHDLNLPVPLEHIERIEVVRGPGSVAWGGHATGGLVNIITRQPAETEFGLGARLGSFSTREADAHAGFGGERSGHLLSATVHVSDGHLPESRSDSDLRRAMYTGHARLEDVELTWGLGAEDKEFGAWMFYTADFPDQREETASRLAYLSARTEAGGWQISPQVFWRGHDDWFRTVVGGIAYINEHETDVRGVQLSGLRPIGQGMFALGGGRIHERIDSNALYVHDRDETSLWAAHRHPLGKRTTLEAGLNAIRFSDYGSEWLPSLGLGYRFTPNWRGFVSSARSARVPSWTELWLATGGNVGSPDLQLERSTFHEAGLQFLDRAHRLGLAVFERSTDDLIDWAREPGEVTWRADNFGGHRTRGGELEWRWQPATTDWLHHLAASWTVLDTRLDHGGREIKYALDYPRHAWTVAGLFDLGAGVGLSLHTRRIERRSGHHATLVSARLHRHFDAVQVFVEGTNLLDEEVIEAGFAPLPGRALFAGLRWRQGP